MSTPAAAFPVHDWQFWVVTAVFLMAAAWIVRALILPIVAPGRGKGKRKKATLTIEGKSVEGR